MTFEEFKEIVTKISKEQEGGCLEGSLLNLLDYLKSDYKIIPVANNLYINKHRYYETSISVFKLNDNLYAGVQGVSDLYAINMEVRDCCETIHIYKMKSKTIITYVIDNDK